MTLVVGVICRDGIVLAADRQATDGGAGIVTVGHAVTKITVVGGDSLFAFSGAVAVGQQLCNAVALKHKEWTQSPVGKAIPDLQNIIRGTLKDIYAGAQAAAPVVGVNSVNSNVICLGLLAAPFKKELHLLETTPVPTIERKIASFVTIGSGKGNADSFLGFLKQTFWPSGQPTVRDGTLAAYWTVKHAIEQMTAGVGMGIDVFVIEANAGSFQARHLSDSELTEHDEVIAECKKALLSVRDGLAKKPASDTTPPPSM